MDPKPPWAPTKFQERAGRLRASVQGQHARVGSRLVTELVAREYGRAIPRYVRGDLVDLGCGKAPLWGTYSKYVDWANSLHDNPLLDRVCDLNQPLPFEDRRFDTIVLSDVLEHIQEPMQLWHEMKRVLRPGGHVLLNVPFLYWIHEYPWDFYRYTEFALERFAREAKLEVVELNAIGGFLEVLTDMTSKRLGRLPVAGRPFAIVTQEIVFRLNERRSRKSAARKVTATFPLGYFMVVRKA
jgi:SAM-dependent methyltransferase